MEFRQDNGIKCVVAIGQKDYTEIARSGLGGLKLGSFTRFPLR